MIQNVTWRIKFTLWVVDWRARQGIQDRRCAGDCKSGDICKLGKACRKKWTTTVQQWNSQQAGIYGKTIHPLLTHTTPEAFYQKKLELLTPEVEVVVGSK